MLMTSNPHPFTIHDRQTEDSQISNSNFPEMLQEGGIESNFRMFQETSTGRGEFLENDEESKPSNPIDNQQLSEQQYFSPTTGYTDNFENKSILLTRESGQENDTDTFEMGALSLHSTSLSENEPFGMYSHSTDLFIKEQQGFILNYNRNEDTLSTSFNQDQKDQGIGHSDSSLPLQPTAIRPMSLNSDFMGFDYSLQGASGDQAGYHMFPEQKERTSGGNSSGSNSPNLERSQPSSGLGVIGGGAISGRAVSTMSAINMADSSSQSQHAIDFSLGTSSFGNMVPGTGTSGGFYGGGESSLLSSSSFGGQPQNMTLGMPQSAPLYGLGMTTNTIGGTTTFVGSDGSIVSYAPSLTGMKQQQQTQFNSINALGTGSYTTGSPGMPLQQQQPQQSQPHRPNMNPDVPFQMAQLERQRELNRIQQQRVTPPLPGAGFAGQPSGNIRNSPPGLPPGGMISGGSAGIPVALSLPGSNLQNGQGMMGQASLPQPPQSIRISVASNSQQKDQQLQMLPNQQPQYVQQQQQYPLQQQQQQQQQYPLQQQQQQQQQYPLQQQQQQQYPLHQQQQQQVPQQQQYILQQQQQQQQQQQYILQQQQQQPLQQQQYLLQQPQQQQQYVIQPQQQQQQQQPQQQQQQHYIIQQPQQQQPQAHASSHGLAFAQGNQTQNIAGKFSTNPDVLNNRVSETPLEDTVVSVCRDILQDASRHSLKAVELANTLRARVGTEVLAIIRERWGGLLSLLERHSDLFRVERIPKNDCVTLITSGMGSAGLPRSGGEGYLPGGGVGGGMPAGFSGMTGQDRKQMTGGYASAPQMNIQSLFFAKEGQVSNCLHVGNVPANITEAQLRKEFERYGPLECLNIVTQKNRRFAFVSYHSIEQAVIAKQRLSKTHPWKSAISFARKDNNMMRPQQTYGRTVERGYSMPIISESEPPVFQENYVEPYGVERGSSMPIISPVSVQKDVDWMRPGGRQRASSNDHFSIERPHDFNLMQPALDRDSGLHQQYPLQIPQQQQQQQQQQQMNQQNRVEMESVVVTPEQMEAIRRHMMAMQQQQQQQQQQLQLQPQEQPQRIISSQPMQTSGMQTGTGFEGHQFSSLSGSQIQSPQSFQQQQQSSDNLSNQQRQPNLPNFNPSGLDSFGQPALESMSMQNVRLSPTQSMMVSGPGSATIHTSAPGPVSAIQAMNSSNQSFDANVLRRLCDDTYVPTQPWPVNGNTDIPFVQAIISQLQLLGGTTTVSKLRGSLRHRISAQDNIKSVPLKALLAAYTGHFILQGNQVTLVNVALINLNVGNSSNNNSGSNTNTNSSNNNVMNTNVNSSTNSNTNTSSVLDQSIEPL